jgi:hypothetical protein
MKKFIMLWIVITSVFYLVGCSDVDYTEEVSALGLEIEELIPDTINSNFILPSKLAYQITYTLDDAVFTDEFIYTSPIYDQSQEIKYTVSRGKTTQDFTKTVYVLSSESGENLTKIYLDLPILESQISKEDYTQANVRVETMNNGVYGIEHETAEAQLRGRGNSTWFSYPKHPYRLRFDKNTSILGMPAAKNYVLLAEFADRSFMRNVVVQKMVSLFNENIYDLETRYVELYINNEYRGLYVLTEQVEIHKNKLFIEALPGVINTGYFLELDKRLYDQTIDPGHFWFVARGYPYEIKDPDPEDPFYVDAQAAYLADYLSVLDQTLMDHSNYEDYMDVDAWVDYFIIQEFIKNVDIGFSSVFLYKEKDGVIKPGPLWDFDFALGNADYIDYGPENWYGMLEYKNRMFKLMMAIPEIRVKFRDRYMDFHFDVLPEIEMMIEVISESISTKADANFTKWPILNEYWWPTPPEVLQENSFVGQINYLQSFIELRKAWMYDEVLSSRYTSGDFSIIDED